MIDRLREFGYSFEQPPNLDDSDIAALLIIERESFPIDYYTREQLLEEYEVNPWLFVVARDSNNNSIGYTSGNLRGETGELVSVAVERSLRGIGIGSSLTSLLIEYLEGRGAKNLEAHTRIDNEPSLRMLNRFGFTVVSQIDDYYRDNSPSLLLRRAVIS